MRFSGEQSVSQNGFLLKAQVDDFTDGHPSINELRLDTLVQTLPPARLAIAGCIAFGAFVGQSVVVTGKVPRMAADAITDFFADRKVVTEPIEDVPASVWPSSGTLHIRHYAAEFTPPPKEPGTEHRFYVQVADGALYNGALASPHQLIVASNAGVMQSMEPEAFKPGRLEVALGVLLSSDLHSRGIHVAGCQDEEFMMSCKRLLRAAELNLTWDRADALR